MKEGQNPTYKNNDELHNLYTPPNITRVIKSRNTRWVGHTAQTGEVTYAVEKCIQHFGWKT